MNSITALETDDQNLNNQLMDFSSSRLDISLDGPSNSGEVQDREENGEEMGEINTNHYSDGCISIQKFQQNRDVQDFVSAASYCNNPFFKHSLYNMAYNDSRIHSFIQLCTIFTLPGLITCKAYAFVKILTLLSCLFSISA